MFHLTQQDAQASGTVVSGIIPVCSVSARVLFDTGATHSFVSSYFALQFVCPSICLDRPLSVATPLDVSVEIRTAYVMCDVLVEGRQMLATLHVLDMIDFDVILGMDWLSAHYATVDCRNRTVVFRLPGEPELMFRGDSLSAPPSLISMIRARRLLSKGCSGYLACVQEVRRELPRLEQVPVVGEFPDVFPDDLAGLPPDREIEFTIDLVPGTGPISAAPYRMAPLELQELKAQLQELLDKGFIRPSVSPWGSPVLFV